MPLSPPFLYMQVNTEVCEQTFSWLSKYSRITRHMNRERFLFYLLYLCYLRNNYKLQSKVKMYEHSTYGWELDITLILQFTHYTENDIMLRAPGWVSPGTVRVTLVSRDTLTQRVPGWVGDGESRDCQSYSGVPGYSDTEGAWVGGGW